MQTIFPDIIVDEPDRVCSRDIAVVVIDQYNMNGYPYEQREMRILVLFCKVLNTGLEKP